MSTLLTAGFELEVEVTRRLCSIIGTDRAHNVSRLLDSGDYRGYLALEPDYTIEDHGDFADDYLLVSLLKKSKFMPFQPRDGIASAKEAAKQKFYSAEMLCKATNDRLSASRFMPGIMNLGKGRNPEKRSKWYEVYPEDPPWVDRARCLIGEILGPLKGTVSAPSGEIRPLDEILRLMKHGPGSTTGVTGDGIVPSLKFDNQVELTEELLPYAASIMGPVWTEYKSRSGLKVVQGNSFFSVPKNAETERGACTGPTLNVFGQLGIGRYMVSRLRMFGCDLHLGWERQRFLASAAQKRGLATIDLSQASDLVAYLAVLLLLPFDWFKLLDLFRERKTFIDEKWVELEKFSAMGNGYTFPLESLIFLGVVRAIVPKAEWDDCGVFGDDIICPQAYAADVIQALEHLGSVVNTKKTFLAGRFFESCGTDWFNGQNVRPFYLFQDPASSFPQPLQIANALRLYAARRFVGYCDGRFKSVWDWLVSQVPAPWSECHVPPTMGDTGLIMDRSEVELTRAQCASLRPPGWRPEKAHHVGAYSPKTRWVCGFSSTEIELAKFARSSGFNGHIEGYSCKHVVLTAVNVDRQTFGVLLAKFTADNPLANRDELVSPGYSPVKALISLEEPTWATRMEIEAAPSKGLEPRRGYVGRIVTKVTNTPCWSNELAWL